VNNNIGSEISLDTGFCKPDKQKVFAITIRRRIDVRRGGGGGGVCSLWFYLFSVRCSAVYFYTTQGKQTAWAGPWWLVPRLVIFGLTYLPSDLVIFYCNLVNFCKVGYLFGEDTREDGLSCFFLDFQPDSSEKQLITCIAVWIFAPTEQASFSNLSFVLFSLLCCL